MQLDIFYRGLIELQRRATLLIHGLVEHFVLSENASRKHLQLLVGEVDAETLPSTFGEREMASEQFRIVQVSFGVELVTVFVPIGMAIEEGRSHTHDSAGRNDYLLAVRVSEDEVIVWSHTILAMGGGRIQTECLFYQSVQEWQSTESRRVRSLIWVRCRGLEFCSQASEDRWVVEDVESQS